MITSGRSIRKFLIKQQERYRAGPACPCTLHFLSLVQPVPSEGLSRAIPSAHIDCPRAASNRVVAFPALHSVSYTFEVVSLNAAGIHSPQPASLSFTINPPFWQTWWFIMLIVGVCLGLAERLAVCPGDCDDAERLQFLRHEFSTLGLKELIDELAWLRNSLNAVNQREEKGGEYE